MNFADLQTPLTDDIVQTNLALEPEVAYERMTEHSKILESRLTIFGHNLNILTQDAERWRGIAAQMQKERDQWKANHDNQVKIKNTIVQRPDLRDRAKRVMELIADLNDARSIAEIARDILSHEYSDHRYLGTRLPWENHNPPQ